MTPPLAGYGSCRCSPSNERLFGDPGRLCVYVSYGIHHCEKRDLSSARTDLDSWLRGL